MIEKIGQSQGGSPLGGGGLAEVAAVEAHRRMEVAGAPVAVDVRTSSTWVRGSG